MKKIIITLTIIYSLFLMACPKGERTVRALREKSAEMSVYGTKLITAFGDSYEEGTITQEQLRKLNTISGAFVKGVGIYRTALDEAERKVRESGGNTDTDIIKRLNALFDEQVVATFFAILAEVGVLPLSQSEVIKSIISGIRLTILAIQGAFSDARHLIRESGKLPQTAAA